MALLYSMPRGLLIIEANTRFRCGLLNPAWILACARMTLYGAGRFFCSSVVAVRLDRELFSCIPQIGPSDSGG